MYALFQGYIRQYVFFIQIFFLVLTLLLVNWKLPETKNKRVGAINKELKYLQGWQSSVKRMDDIQRALDVDSAYQKFITPKKLQLDQWKIDFIENEAPGPIVVRNKKRLISITDEFQNENSGENDVQNAEEQITNENYCEVSGADETTGQ